MRLVETMINSDTKKIATAAANAGFAGRFLRHYTKNGVREREREREREGGGGRERGRESSGGMRVRRPLAAD